MPPEETVAPANDTGAATSQPPTAPASSGDSGSAQPSTGAGASPSTTPNIETGTVGAGTGPAGAGADTAVGATQTEFDFGSLFAEPPIQASPPPQSVSPAPAPPVQQQTPPQVAAQTAPPAQATAAPPQSSQQPPQAAPSLDLANPYHLAVALTQNEAGAIQHLAEGMFKLSPEDIEGLESDVVGTIPRLLSRAVVKSQQQFLTQMARLVPTMIQRHSEVMQRHSKNEDQFYAKWPDIDRVKHRDLVMRYAAMYRQMNPDATLDRMVNELGPMIMMGAGIQPQPKPTGPSTTANGGRPPPFVPAQPGAVGRPQAIEANPWDYIGRNE